MNVAKPILFSLAASLMLATIAGAQVTETVVKKTTVYSNAIPVSDTVVTSPATVVTSPATVVTSPAAAAVIAEPGTVVERALIRTDAPFVQKTITVYKDEPAAITLAPTGTYIVIDPVTGVLKGSLDPLTMMLNGTRLSAGYLIIDQKTNRVVATSDVSGRLIAITTAPVSEALVASIEARRDEINRAIAEALTRGTLTAPQATSMRARLDAIMAAELAAKQSNGLFTYAEALSLANDLSILQDEVRPLISSTLVLPVTGMHFVTTDGALVRMTDFDYKKAVTERRIDDEYNAGRLSSSQVARLKEELNELASREARYLRNGELSDSEAIRLADKMDRILNHLNQDIADINAKRSRIGLRVD
jgi:hypothetical protein